MFGGLGAKASGGSFEDGAMRGLFVHLFNDEAKIWKFKTRIGAVFQVHGGFGRGSGTMGLSISPGYKEWNWSNGTSYPAGDVTAKLRLGHKGFAEGWVRKDSIEWSDYQSEKGVMTVSFGFIVGATVELNYGQILKNIGEGWKSHQLFPDTHIGNWHKSQ